MFPCGSILFAAATRAELASVTGAAASDGVTNLPAARDAFLQSVAHADRSSSDINMPVGTQAKHAMTVAWLRVSSLCTTYRCEVLAPLMMLAMSCCARSSRAISVYWLHSLAHVPSSHLSQPCTCPRVELVSAMPCQILTCGAVFSCIWGMRGLLVWSCTVCSMTCSPEMLVHPPLYRTRPSMFGC